MSSRPPRFSIISSGFSSAPVFVALFAAALIPPPSFAADAPIPSPLGRKDAPLYTDFHPHGQTFVEATVDLRGRAPAGTTDHLVPRALVLPLAPDVHVAFDTELLRVAAVWQGDFLSPYSMAMLSYPHPLQKIPAGQEQLAQPQGDIVATTGLYPGWHPADHADFTDPRPRGIDPHELGRGPLPASIGRWRSLDDHGDHAVLHYEVHGRAVTERFRLDSTAPAVVRELVIAAGDIPLDLVLADGHTTGAEGRVEGAAVRWLDDRHRLARVPAAPTPTTLTVRYPLPRAPAPAAATPPAPADPPRVTTRFSLGEPQGSYAVDELQLPYPNPWQRRIRPMDIDFRPNGEAVLVTFDGDVYRLRGLSSADGAVEWIRIASGFNEPQSIRVRGHDVFVFSRGGITRLIDRDGDGDTDTYELFSNLVVQSAETRGYPASMIVLPDDSFLLSTGGIQNSHPAPHAGRALHLSADGRALEVYAEGLRNAYLNHDPASNLITSSDQQGNWVPATPLHWIRRGHYYGFEPGTTEVREPAPVPLWIPHRVAQSGIDQITGFDARAGALRGAMLYVDYYRPRLVKILTEPRPHTLHAAAMPLPVAFQTPLLKGEINPADGFPYFVGMQIWGSRAQRIEGLCRLRPLADDDGLPRRARVYREGVLLRFAHPLPPGAFDPAHYRVTAWNYRRTENYGSGQFRRDGGEGVDPQIVHAVVPSFDRRGVFLAVPDLAPAMQLAVEFSHDGETWTPVYFTVRDEPPFQPRFAGFTAINFPALFAGPPQARGQTETVVEVSIERGRTLTETYGCIGCHSLDGTTEGKSGPTWRGLFGQRRPLADGRTVLADAAYLRDAILQPTQDVVLGYNPQEAGMPPYQGVFSDADLQSLVLYLQSLR